MQAGIAVCCKKSSEDAPSYLDMLEIKDLTCIIDRVKGDAFVDDEVSPGKLDAPSNDSWKQHHSKIEADRGKDI